jgi:hypothetical protein
MPKPKGGRGKAAPYTTRQVRVPEPVIPQVDRLIEKYQDYLEHEEDVNNPPSFLIENKPVDKFIPDEKLQEIKIILEDALKLKANAGGAIKERIRLVLQLLCAE